MDEKKQPGIRFIGIHLIDVDFHLYVENKNDLKANMSFNIANKIEGSKLFVELTVKINEPEIKTEPFFLSAKFIGQFESDPEDGNMSLPQFAEVNAPALMFPYVRELVTNITGRSAIPPLIIPPVNLRGVQKTPKALTGE